MRCNITQDEPTNKKPGFHIAIMLVEIWSVESMLDYTTEPSPRANVILTECDSLHVQENYRQTVCGMELKLPKGTVLRRTIASEKDVEDAGIKTYVDTEDSGVIVKKVKASDKLATAADFKIGSRIRVYAAYTSDWKGVASLNNAYRSPNIYTNNDLLNKYKENMDKIFDGFITQCSPASPWIIKGENLMSIFKRMSCPKRTSQTATLKDILDPNGSWRLIKDIFELHSSNTLDKLGDVHVSPVVLSNEMTVADAFAEWSKRFGIYFRILDEVEDSKLKPKLKIGYTYSSGATPGGTDLCICQNADGQEPVIYFDYNVADDGLTYIDTDPYYIMIKCVVPIIKTKGGRGKFTFHLKLKEDGGYEMVDKTIINRKGIKSKNTKPYFNYSGYTIIDRIYPDILKESDVSSKEEELKKWAIQQYEDTIKNGLSGTLSLFGDLGLHTGEIVILNDKRHPKRNGKYIVEEVVTTLSQNGLRQNIKIPYKLT